MEDFIEMSRGANFFYFSLFVNKAKFAGVLGFAVALVGVILGIAVISTSNSASVKVGVSVSSF